MSAAHFQLRAYCYIDRMQPQYAGFRGTVTQGDLPVEGMASLFVEMAPGNEVFRLVYIAVKATEARPGSQVVEREFGMFEIHSHSQAAVLEAGAVVLSHTGLQESDRIKPSVASLQIITNVDPYQAQLLNRRRHASMLVTGETLFVMEVAPAAYAVLAANEAEKAAHINILEVRAFGSFGRVYLGGEERDIMAGYGAAVAAIEGVSGREMETQRRD